MAIAPTGAIYKSLSFDGVESRNFGVYITGEAVYNAPARDVEMVSIPGRNGTFALDKGRFENIEVSYPAGIFADNETDFASAVSDFRNYLCSRKGYCRLVDEYNPEEYRMAIYKSGLDVSPAQLKAGEFDITFDCKPQRWLMGGEAAIDVSDGDTIFNPTLFDSSPLLAAEGYGTIGFNGYEIEIDNATMGEVLLANSMSTVNASITENFTTSAFNSGDAITAGEISFVYKVPKDFITAYGAITALSNSDGSFSSSGVYDAEGSYIITTVLQGITRTKGSAETQLSNTTTGTQTYGSASFSCTVWLNDSRLWINNTSGSRVNRQSTRIGEIKGISTASILGHPTYIDCDLGEAYRIDGDTITSLNQYIDLGSDLPKLASGPNEITFDNTITELEITPRWWRV